MGKGHLLHPWKCRKVLFVLQMLSKASVDLSIYACIILSKCLRLLGALPQTSTGVLPLYLAKGLPSFKPLIANSWKKSCGCPWF